MSEGANLPLTRLTQQELRDLLRPSDRRGLEALIVSWGLIAGSFALAALVPHPLVYLLAIIVIGGRQLALAILMHECAHRTLFATRSLNDRLGQWLCAWPVWQDLVRYREHHLKHHRYTGTEKDPDLSLVTPYPTTRASLARKIARDLVGWTGVRRMIAQLAMDLGYLTYTIAADPKPIAQDGRARMDVLQMGARNLRGMLGTNAVLLALLWLVGHPGLYLLWVCAYLTTFSVFIRIRSIAEHACLPGTDSRDPDMLRNTRTTRAGWIARLTVAPHRVNFHLEHHLAMAVPHFNLPRMHRILRDRGALESATLASGYLSVLELAAAKGRLNTPGVDLA